MRFLPLPPPSCRFHLYIHQQCSRPLSITVSISSIGSIGFPLSLSPTNSSLGSRWMLKHRRGNSELTAWPGPSFFLFWAVLGGRQTAGEPHTVRSCRRVNPAQLMNHSLHIAHYILHIVLCRLEPINCPRNHILPSSPSLDELVGRMESHHSTIQAHEDWTQPASLVTHNGS